MPRWLRWILARPFSAAAAAYLLVSAIRFMLIKDFSEWDYVFVQAARGLLGGKDFYVLTPQAQDHAYSYPPLMALLAIPFAWLWPGGGPHDIGRFIGRFIWFAITAGCAVVLWRGCWKAAGGPRIEGPRPDKREQLACVIGLLCAVRFVEDNLDHQQADLLIAALLIAGVLAWQRGRDLLAATWFGLGAAIKGPPMLLAAYLLWRGRWKAAAWMVLLAVGVNLLPDLVRRPPAGGLWLGQWYHHMIQPLARENPGDWSSNITNNQSISGFFNRVTGAADGVPRLSPGQLKAAVYGTELMIALLAAWALRRPLRLPAGDGPPRRALECSLVMLVMLLFSPMSSKPHFCVMLLPAMLLARRAVRHDLTAAAALAICIILVDLLDRNVVDHLAGPGIGNWAMRHGAVTWGALALAAGCMVAIFRRGSGNDPLPSQYQGEEK